MKYIQEDRLSHAGGHGVAVEGYGVRTKVTVNQIPVPLCECAGATDAHWSIADVEKVLGRPVVAADAIRVQAHVGPAPVPAAPAPLAQCVCDVPVLSPETLRCENCGGVRA